MKHLLGLCFSAVVAVITTAIFWAGRTAIGTSTPLLLTIVGGYLLALGAAFPSQMGDARAQCDEWYRAWKNPTGGAP